jgi:riboflavin biosynthesis pyrimidine reductase
VDVRILIDADGRTGDVGTDDLPALYEPPRRPWLRANMVASVDGAVSGADGRSGSLNNEADHAVFDTLRASSDAILVGAGTARTEGYGPAGKPIVVVSRRGEVPEKLRDAPAGSVLLATAASAPWIAEAHELLGDDGVLVVGADQVEPVRLRDTLVERGFGSILCEGGPSLLGDLLAAGVVDELCRTVVPVLVGGDAGRIVHGPAAGLDVDLRLLLESEGTLLERWLVRR